MKGKEICWELFLSSFPGHTIDLYPLKDTKVEPTLYLAMTDNWIEMTLRFVVDAQERRKVKGQLHLDLLQHFQAEESITVASTTIEIVGSQPILADQRNK